MKIKWTKASIRDLKSIQKFVSGFSPEKAKGVLFELGGHTETLAQFPGRGRPGRKMNTRELVFADLPYIVVYRVVANRVEVLRVLHTSRKWP